MAARAEAGIIAPRPKNDRTVHHVRRTDHPLVLGVNAGKGRQYERIDLDASSIIVTCVTRVFLFHDDEFSVSLSYMT
jgi:hypothetical protein